MRRGRRRRSTWATTRKAGLLSITGKYTQLATGTMTGLINGTAAGTGFSQLKVTGTAALAGTINFTVATAFQASLTLGETFTVLTSSAVSGTFSNSTIAINGTFQFNVSYTSTGVVLTVASATPNGGSQPGSQTTTAMPVATARLARATTTARKGREWQAADCATGVEPSKIARPVVVAAWTPVANAHSDAILAGGFEKNNLRSWEHVPVISASQAPDGSGGAAPRAVNEISTHNSSGIRPADGRREPRDRRPEPAGRLDGHHRQSPRSSQTSSPNAPPHIALTRGERGHYDGTELNTNGVRGDF